MTDKMEREMNKSTPIRTCAACRVEAPQELLQRLTLVAGELQTDSTKRAEGRGVYVHPEHDLSDMKTRDKVIRSVSRRSK